MKKIDIIVCVFFRLFTFSMATILASHSSCCHTGESRNHRRMVDDLSLSGSLRSLPHFNKSLKNLVNTSKQYYSLQVEMEQKKMPDNVTKNGRVIEMVPTSEIKKRMSLSKSTSENINRPAKNVDGAVKNVNGVHILKEDSVVKKDNSLSLVKSSKHNALPSLEELKILPSSEGFSWANENYNSIQRNIDIWSFFISLRLRILLDNARWTYIGGFTEDKQVGSLSTCLLTFSALASQNICLSTKPLPKFSGRKKT